MTQSLERHPWVLLRFDNEESPRAMLRGGFHLQAHAS